MHMADALVSPIVAGTMYTCSAAVAIYSGNKVKVENDLKKVSAMGVMGAFVFATQMINFTIPGTGSSGHLCGGMLLAVILGPYAAFCTMIGILMIQCLMFADGGLLALGANIWNMAFYGCFIGYFFIWRPLTKAEITKKRIIIASILGCILTLQLGAFSVTLETLSSGITMLPFSIFVGVMQPIHLAIGLIEGLITAAVLIFVFEARPELFQESNHYDLKGKMSFKKTLTVLGIITLLIGGGLSLAASSKPDGLEWSIEKITGSNEIKEKEKGIYEKAKQLQNMTAVLPDYSFQNSKTVLGTTFSGIAGSGVILIICMTGCYAFNIIRKSKKNE